MAYQTQTQMGSPIVDLMTDMAAGESHALFALLERHRGDLTRTVRWLLQDLGRSDAASSIDDLEFLIQTAALVIFDRARGWQPGGAAPWTWASRSIRAEVVKWLGHPRIRFDGQIHDRTDPAERWADLDLNELARRDERVAAWIESVGEAANERDRAVHLEYQTQKHLGDRSPAHTVGAMFDLTPANVRQIDTRVRRRLQQLTAAKA